MLFVLVYLLIGLFITRVAWTWGVSKHGYDYTECYMPLFMIIVPLWPLALLVISVLPLFKFLFRVADRLAARILSRSSKSDR